MGAAARAQFEAVVSAGGDVGISLRPPHYAELLEAFAPSKQGKPVAVIANTIKGKGVSFMENRVEWHHKVPSAEQVELAIEELTR